MPDLTREEVERRLADDAAARRSLSQDGRLLCPTEREALQTALSLYARAEDAEKERDEYYRKMMENNSLAADLSQELDAEVCKRQQAEQEREAYDASVNRRISGEQLLSFDTQVKLTSLRRQLKTSQELIDKLMEDVAELSLKLIASEKVVDSAIEYRWRIDSMVDFWKERQHQGIVQRFALNSWKNAVKLADNLDAALEKYSGS